MIVPVLQKESVMKKHGTCLVFTLFLVIAIISACAPREYITIIGTPIPTTAPTEAPASPTEVVNPLAQYYLPLYYPSQYLKIIEDSKAEKDGLLVYSIMSDQNWARTIQTFNAHYPWIKVTTTDMGADEVFSTYKTDLAAGNRTADMIVSSAPGGWQTFIKEGQLQVYASPEDSNVPDWSKLAPGVYSVSADLMLIIYNKKLVSNPPDTMTGLITAIKADPQKYIGKITTYDASLNATGYNINWFWVKFKGEENARNALNIIGAESPVLKTSATQMVDAVVDPQNPLMIGYFVSAISVFPRLATEPDLGWSYIRDGQPVLVRGMGITQKARSPNSARLFLDFILSQEGQYALSIGGLTPYRSDVVNVAEHHLNQVASDVSESNLIFFFFDPNLLDTTKTDAFMQSWKNSMGIK
jgi:iron(III) transport system substrate-binding protein